MLVLLPLLSVAGGILTLGSLFPDWGWRRTFLRSVVLAGAYTIVSTEVLSLIKGITPLGLAIVWASPAALTWGWLTRETRRGRHFRIPKVGLPASWADKFLLLCVVAIIGVTALVAWLAPPNTWDSMTYHMSRVAHWAQDHSLGPYATGIERQNFMSPGAEIAILHTYVLSGGDRLANLVEWSAMVASLIGVALIASQLGASGTGQLVAVVFTATLPMGIAQASSTMTDYVVALWSVAVASETLSMAQGEKPDQAAVFSSVAAGLAVASKPTSLAYLTPFALWILALLARRLRPAALFRLGAIGVLAVTVLNAGYFGRNLTLEGTLAGGRSLASVSVNETLPWQGLVSNLLRNASLHAGTPWPEINQELYLAIAKVHVKIGLPDVGDPRFSRHDVFLVRVTNSEENRAPNTQHAVMMVFAFPLALAFGRRTGRPIAIYALAVCATFLLFSAIFKFDQLASRYHLPFFVLAAPVVGATLGYPVPVGLGRAMGLVLVVLSWPWLTGIENRQLLPAAGRPVTILNQPRDRLYMPGGGSEGFAAVAESIQQAQCRQVGVMLCGDCTEYVLWAYLRAPRADLQVQWIVAGTPSERFASPGFRPCAVVCDQSCPADWTEIRGLRLAMERSGLRLFMDTGKNATEP